MAKMFGSRVVCRVGRTTSWFIRLVSSPARSLRNGGALTPRCPDDELRRNDLAARELDALRQHLGHLGARAHADSQFLEQHGRAFGQARREARQDAIGGFDQDELDVLFRIDAIESVRDERARGVVQLGGELDSGCPGADDRDVELRGAYRPGLGMGAQERIDESSMEALRLRRRVESDRIVGSAWRSKSLVWLPTAMTRACRS
jgi:hypothetical protein